MMRLTLVAGITVVLLAAGVWRATAEADRLSHGVPAAEREQISIYAHAHWDHPLQRLAFVALAVDRAASPVAPSIASRCAGGLAGRWTGTWEVTALTFFGIPAAQAIVTCDGSVNSE